MNTIETHSALQIIPLGGLNEIGMNMMVYQYGEEIIIVDCGLMFPSPDMLGIDYVIPDISWLRERAAQIRAICLTHGHEDHIGALPFVLQELNVPVYGTALTLGLVGAKLEEYKLDDCVEMIVVKPRDTVELGSFPGGVPPRGPLHRGWLRPGHHHTRRGGDPYRRLQDRPDPGGWSADRPGQSVPLRRSRGPGAPLRLYQCGA